MADGDDSGLQGPMIILSQSDKSKVKEGAIECYDIEVKMEDNVDFNLPTEIEVKVEPDFAREQSEKTEMKLGTTLPVKEEDVSYSNSTMQCAEALLDLAQATGEVKTPVIAKSAYVKKNNFYPVRLNSEWINSLDLAQQQIFSDHNYAACYYNTVKSYASNSGLSSSASSVRSSKVSLKSEAPVYDADLHNGAQMLSDFCEDMQKLYANCGPTSKKGSRLLFNKKSSRFEIKQKENKKNKMCPSYGPKPVGRPKFSTAKKKKVTVPARSKSSYRQDPYEFTETDDNVALPPLTSPVRKEKKRGPKSKKYSEDNLPPQPMIAESPENEDKYSNFQMLMTCLEAAESQDGSDQSHTSESVSPQSEHFSTRSTSPVDMGADVLELGQATSGKEGMFPCLYCRKTFLKKRYLTKHSRRMHPGMLIANKMRNYKVERHKKSCFTELNSMSCPHCNKTLYKEHFQQHLTVCSKSTKYVTTSCTIVNNTSLTYSDSNQFTPSCMATSPPELSGDSLNPGQDSTCATACEYCGELIPRVDLLSHTAICRRTESSGSISSDNSDISGARPKGNWSGYPKLKNCDTSNPTSGSASSASSSSGGGIRRSKQYIVPKVSNTSKPTKHYIIPRTAGEWTKSKSTVQSSGSRSGHLPPRITWSDQEQCPISTVSSTTISTPSIRDGESTSAVEPTIKPTISYYTTQHSGRLKKEVVTSTRREGLDSNVRDKILLSC